MEALTDENPVRTDRDAAGISISSSVFINYTATHGSFFAGRSSQPEQRGRIFVAAGQRLFKIRACYEALCGRHFQLLGVERVTAWKPDTLSRNNSLRGRRHPSTMRHQWRQHRHFEEDEEPRLRNHHPPNAEVVEDEEENISKIRIRDTTLGTVHTLNERSKLTAEARLELSSLRLNARYFGPLSWHLSP